MRIIAIFIILLLLTACGGRVDSDAGSFVDKKEGGRAERQSYVRPDVRTVQQVNATAENLTG